MSLLSRDRIYRRSTLICLGSVVVGGLLSIVFPWGGLPLALVSALTGWAFWAQGKRADEIIERITYAPQDHLLAWDEGGERRVLGISGLYQFGELCDFVNGFRVDGLRLYGEEPLTLELELGSRTGRPMPVFKRISPQGVAQHRVEAAAERLAEYFECPLER